MSVGPVPGLFALNLWFLLSGYAVLFAFGGFEAWTEVLRLAGVAYVLGLAVDGIIWSWHLVLGIDMSLYTIGASGLLVVVGGFSLGVRLGRPHPAAVTRPRFPQISLPAGVFGAAVIIYLEALFRSGRLAGLYEFDAWSFWVPKAKAIFFFGGLDQQFLHELPHQSYPPLVPALEAAAFNFMGSADVVTLHLQFWFVIVGFVAAVAGVLCSRVSTLALWAPFLLLLVTPHLVGHALQPQSDVVLDVFTAVGALLVALWLTERRGWYLFGAAVLLGGAMLTKRDGYLFAAVVFLPATVVSLREPRVIWLKPLIAGAASTLIMLPWRIFLSVHDLSAEGPEAGGLGLVSHLDRAWPSLRLALSTLFDFQVWLVVVPLFLLAIAAAFAAGAVRLPAYASLLWLACVAGLAWTTWAFPSLPITKGTLNPIVRLSGGLVFTAAVLTPLLVQTVLVGARRIEAG